ncbi:MAG: hypothetical protein R3F19_13975 [Verrucomicrobiales bacterium]
MFKPSTHPRLRRCLKRLFILAGCIAAFYAVEYWRGWRKWTAFRTEWEARGENFNRPDIPTIPDDQNAAMAPLMQELTGIWQTHPEWFVQTLSPTAHNRGRLWDFGKKLEFSPAAGSGRITRIGECRVSQLAGGAWRESEIALSGQEAQAAREILARFGEFTEIIGELDEMLTRPSLALPASDRNDIIVPTPPHADALYAAVRALQLRARASLRLGESAAAFADIERSLQVGKLLIDGRSANSRSWLMGTSVLQSAGLVIWEAMLTADLDREKLEHLQALIDQIDIAPGLLFHLRGIRADDIEAATSSQARARHNEWIETWNRRLPKAFGKNKGYAPFELLRPQGWRYADLTNRLSDWQEAVFTNADGTINTDSLTLSMVIAAKQLEEPQSSEPGKLMITLSEAAARIGINFRPTATAARSLPGLAQTVFLVERRSFDLSGMLRLTSTAIALELFHSDNGSYPKSLSGLVPGYLADPPIDPWDGEQLLHYTIRPGGRPALWSIGENQVDDKGFLGKHGAGDDIIWHYEIAPDDPDHPDHLAERDAASALKPQRKRRKKTATE